MGADDQPAVRLSDELTRRNQAISLGYFRVTQALISSRMRGGRADEGPLATWRHVSEHIQVALGRNPVESVLHPGSEQQAKTSSFCWTKGHELLTQYMLWVFQRVAQEWPAPQTTGFDRCGIRRRVPLER